MTKRKTPTKAKVGRPSTYRPDIHPKIAREHLAAGKTQEGCAIALGINRDTFFKWKQKYQSFADAVKEGCDIADENVVAALSKSAQGYTVEQTVAEGVTLSKDVPPNPTSMIFWLKNRKPDQWRDKREVVADIKTTDMTEDALNEKIKQLIGDG